MNKLIVLEVIALSVSSLEINIPSYLTFQDFQGINVLVCIQDVSQIVKDTSVLVEDIKTNPLNISQHIKGAVSIIKDIQKALPDCGANINLAPLTNGVFNAASLPQCLADI